MAISYPDTLLIGNIHWIADPNYIIHTSPETTLIHGQLLDFQVSHICQHLHIATHNVFHTPIPRSHLLKEIKDQMKSTPFVPSIDCVECAQYGLVCPVKDENRYTFRNIGGKPLIEFKLNANQTELDSIGQSIPYDLTHPSNNEIVPFILPKNHFESIIGTPPHPLHGGGSGGSGISMKKEKRSKKHHTSKRRISDMYRQNSIDTIDLYGKIDDDHHTYPGTLNTPLMFLIYYMKSKTGQDDELWDIIEYYQHRLLTLNRNAKINKFMVYYRKYANTLFQNALTPVDILSILLDQHSFKIVYNDTTSHIEIKKRKPIAIFLKHTHPRPIKYTLMMKIMDLGRWVHYDGSYNTHRQNDYFVDVGNFDEMLAYQNGMCAKYMFATVYQ
jgi:hypothetical protein